MFHKLSKFFVVLVVFFSMISPAFTVAQSCSACSTAPKTVRQYFDMMEDLIRLLEQHPWEVADQSRLLPDDMQTWDWEIDPRVDIINLANRLARSMEVARLVASSYLPPHLDWTTFKELDILASGPTMQRDWELLLEIDRKISDAFVKMYIWNYLTVRVSDSVLEQINQHLQATNYMRLRRVWSSYNMKQAWAEYRDFGFLLWQLNGIFKEIHAELRFQSQLKDTTNRTLVAHLDDPDEATDHPIRTQLLLVYKSIQELIQQYMAPVTNNRTWMNFEWIEFEDDARKFMAAVWQAQYDYECAVWVKNLCDSWWLASVEQSWGYTKDLFMQDAKSAINTFKVAFSRLKWALFVWSDTDKAAAQQRRNQILHSQYARDLHWFQKWRLQSERWVEENVTQTWQSTKWLKRVLQRVVNNRFINVTWNASSSQTSDFLWSGVELAKNLVTWEKNNANEFSSQSEKEEKLEDLQEYFDEMTDVTWWSDRAEIRSFINQSTVSREISSFQNTYESMKLFQSSLTQQAVMMDPYEFTKQFPALSNAVHQNIRLIGTKSWEWDTKWLYHFMGEVCSQQCAENLQWRCWYDV
jgi:hypothetical protein